MSYYIALQTKRLCRCVDLGHAIRSYVKRPTGIVRIPILKRVLAVLHVRIINYLLESVVARNLLAGFIDLDHFELDLVLLLLRQADVAAKALGYVELLRLGIVPHLHDVAHVIHVHAVLASIVCVVGVASNHEAVERRIQLHARR